MASIGQIRGMILEEVLLYLLRASGYRVIDEINPNDDTVKRGKAGLELLGRGGVHQIDAIADFVVAPPFSNPQRLLVEAKFLNKAVGIEVVRNAIGVLKDVEEYWVSRSGAPAKARYHYQYALFSATSYSEPAQRYAYAQDIFLIPLANSSFLRPVLDRIGNLTAQSFGAESNSKIPVNLSNFRFFIRSKLNNSEDRYNNIDLSIIFHRKSIPFRNSEDISFLNIIDEIDNTKNHEEGFNYDFHDALYQEIYAIRKEAQSVNTAVVGMLSRQFPIFLMPDSRTNLQELLSTSPHQVRIFWDVEQGWWIESASSSQIQFKFSFDLPQKLFELYQEEGLLTETRALDMKLDYLSEIEAIYLVDQEPRIIRFLLSREWLDKLRNSFKK